MKKFLKNKKILIILIGILIVVGFLIGWFAFDSKKDAEQILILDEEMLVIELGDEVSINPMNYLNKQSQDIREEELTLLSNLLTSSEYQVNEEKKMVTTKNKDYLDVGKYLISIKYKEEILEFFISVVDTTPPEFIEFKEEITIEQNSVDFDILKFFKASDLSNVIIDVDTEIDISKIGEIVISIIAKDNYDNKQIKKTKLKIVSIEEAKKEGIITPTLDGIIYKSEKMTEYESKKTPPENEVTFPDHTITPPTESKEPPTNKDPFYRTDIIASYESQINAYRVSQGLTALPVTAEAKSEANMRAMQLVTNYAHNSSFGFGENIGYGTAGSDFFTAWKNSPGHNATMLREQAVAFAVSVVEYNGKWYAVSSFRMNY